MSPISLDQIVQQIQAAGEAGTTPHELRNLHFPDASLDELEQLFRSAVSFFEQNGNAHTCRVLLRTCSSDGSIAIRGFPSIRAAEVHAQKMGSTSVAENAAVTTATASTTTNGSTTDVKITVQRITLVPQQQQVSDDAAAAAASSASPIMLRMASRTFSSISLVPADSDVEQGRLARAASKGSYPLVSRQQIISATDTASLIVKSASTLSVSHSAPSMSNAAQGGVQKAAGSASQDSVLATQSVNSTGLTATSQGDGVVNLQPQKKAKIEDSAENVPPTRAVSEKVGVSSPSDAASSDAAVKTDVEKLKQPEQSAIVSTPASPVAPPVAAKPKGKAAANSAPISGQRPITAFFQVVKTPKPQEPMADAVAGAASATTTADAPNQDAALPAATTSSATNAVASTTTTTTPSGKAPNAKPAGKKIVLGKFKTTLTADSAVSENNNSTSNNHNTNLASGLIDEDEASANEPSNNINSSGASIATAPKPKAKAAAAPHAKKQTSKTQFSTAGNENRLLNDTPPDFVTATFFDSAVNDEIVLADEAVLDSLSNGPQQLQQQSSNAAAETANNSNVPANAFSVMMAAARTINSNNNNNGGGLASRSDPNTKTTSTTAPSSSAPKLANITNLSTPSVTHFFTGEAALLRKQFVRRVREVVENKPNGEIVCKDVAYYVNEMTGEEMTPEQFDKRFAMLAAKSASMAAQQRENQNDSQNEGSDDRNNARQESKQGGTPSAAAPAGAATAAASTAKPAAPQFRGPTKKAPPGMQTLTAFFKPQR